MISPLTGTLSTEEKSKQNVTRDTEVKNNLTIARGEGRRVFRNYSKGHMDKTKGGDGSKGGRWVWLRWGKGVGRKDEYRKRTDSYQRGCW